MSNKVQANQSNALLPRITLIIAKIAEILHWCLAGVMLISALIAAIQPAEFTEWVKYNILHGETILSCCGLEVAIADADGTLRSGALFCFALGGAIVLSLMAMVFRNVYLILKTAEGKTWFSKGDTPFQKNIVRMFREIGLFFIAISAISLISEIIIIAVGGELTTGFNYLSCFIGLVFLCVSQFFNYGTRLEKDLDGLV